MKKSQNMMFKSQHLVINPGQGPALECAPGHDSIKGSRIIKSHCLESGVMEFQNLKLRIRVILEGAEIYSRATCLAYVPE